MFYSKLIAMLPFALDSACYRERPSVHIGVLSISVALQSFRRPLRTREKTRSQRETRFIAYLNPTSCLLMKIDVLHQLACGGADPGVHPTQALRTQYKVADQQAA